MTEKNHTDANAKIWGCRPGIWAGLLILAVTAVRVLFIQSGQLDLVQDEAQYWDWSRTPQLSYFTKGPLIAYIISGGTALFGNTDLGVRFGAVAGSLLSQVIMYLGLARLMGRPRLGLLTLVVYNCTLFAMASGFLMTTDNPLMVCWFAALFCLYWASKTPEKWLPFIILALAVAVGTWGKYMMLAFAGTAVVFGLMLKMRALDSAVFWKRLALALGVGCVLGLLPIIIWNFGNDFAGFKHVSALAGTSGKNAQAFIRFDRFPEYFGSQIGLMLPWWFYFMLTGAVGALAVVFKSTARAARNADGLEFREAALFVAGFWPVWAFFIFWSFHTKIHPNWSAVSYASGFVLAAAGWDAFARRRGWKNWRVWLWPALGLLLFAAVHVHHKLPIPYRMDVRLPFTDEVKEIENPALHLKGWGDMGREVDYLRQTRFDDVDRVFLFADHYDVTSALSYHVPGQQRAYCVNTGRRLNQYDLWPGPQDKKGWDAIYVRQKFKAGPPTGVPELFERIERIPYQSYHKGQPARRFTIYLCYGYTGEWPQPEGSGY